MERSPVYENPIYYYNTKVGQFGKGLHALEILRFGEEESCALRKKGALKIGAFEARETSVEGTPSWFTGLQLTDLGKTIAAINWDVASRFEP